MRSPPERLLLGPGPSPVSDRVRRAMAEPLVGHMDPWFLELLDEIARRLRAAFRTENELTFAVSGTGSAGMQAAMVNLIEPGDEFAVVINGAFGERMAEMASRLGASVIRVETEWGTAVEAALVEEALLAHPSAKGLAVVHAETSTGVRQPLEEIGDFIRSTDTVFVVDAVTSLGGIEVAVDDWGVDVCYSGTQKCLGAPPGLSPITFSPRAVERIESRSSPVSSWYLDATMIRRYWGSERVYHHTPPIPMLYALSEALAIVEEEGLEMRWARHTEVGSRLQSELISRGFTLFAADGFRLPQLTSLLLPPESDDRALRKRLLGEFGIEVGGGLGSFAGKMWRVGLMGEGARHDSVDRFLAAVDALFAV